MEIFQINICNDVDSLSMDVVPGSSFTNPSSAKIDQQRKILEDLERQKKLLKAGGAPVGLGAGTVTAPSIGGLATGVGIQSGPASAQVSPSVGEGHITSGQRSALEAANKNSFGFFIPQDSAFGNIILPVIPRIQAKAATASTK